MREPAGGVWDAVSWGDVLGARDALVRGAAELARLLSSADADPSQVADLFERLRDSAAAGIMAAAWCEPARDDD